MDIHFDSFYDFWIIIWTDVAYMFSGGGMFFFLLIKFFIIKQYIVL